MNYNNILETIGNTPVVRLKQPAPSAAASKRAETRSGIAATLTPLIRECL